MKLKLIISILIALTSSFTSAQAPIQELRASTKQKTQVMILGTFHLSSVKSKPLDEPIAPVLSMLEDFRPTAIAVEALRPADIIGMLHGEESYQPILDQFVGEESLALAKSQQDRLNLSPSQALAKRNELLSNSEFKDSTRLEIIRLSIAAYDINTALLHWRYLKNNANTEQLTPELQEHLKKLASSNNENNIIAAALALKLGLNHLYPIDDHLDKNLYPAVVSRLMPSYQRSSYAKNFANSDYVSKPQRLKEEALRTGDWLPLFAWMNSKSYQQQVLDQEWRMFIDKDLDTEPGLARVALWEIRNLNMASNIMRVVAQNIGGRVLVVVGANHKVFLEEYLSNMISADIVQFEVSS